MTTYRVLSDTLYRSVAIVTTDNVVTEAYDCDAYGNTLCYSGPGTDALWFTDDDVQTNNPINTTIFTGREFDPESLIYYYRARYFSPQIGRFISRDPLENAELSQGPNLYWYVRNNAINRTDPTGLSGRSSLGGGSDLDEAREFVENLIDEDIDKILNDAKECVNSAVCYKPCVKCITDAVDKVETALSQIDADAVATCFALAEDPPALIFCLGFVDQQTKSAAQNADTALLALMPTCQKLPGQ